MKVVTDVSEIARLYDRIADPYTSCFFRSATLRAEEAYLEEVASYLRPGALLLDVGCGPGIEAQFFQARGFVYEGIDASPNMVRIARTKNPKGIFRTMKMENLEYPSRHFDGLIALESLIHFRKSIVPALLCEFRRVMKEGAPLLLALQEGSGEGPEAFPFDPSVRVWVNRFSREELSEVLRRTGFKSLSTSSRPPLAGELSFNKLVSIAQAS